MFELEPIIGSSLAEGVLALTFDDGPGLTDGDGPGPKTERLATFLSDAAIPATFFMCGKHVRELPDLPGRLGALGHVVANHTHNHPDLTRPEPPVDVVAEVRDTDALIGAGPGVTYFRPPYGSWSDGVAAALNVDTELAQRYVGPINWDIDGDDWAAWRDGVSPAVCAENYLRATQMQGRGIVLMHDSTADNETWKQANGSLELVQILVPWLRQRGFTFVALDDVPDVRSACHRVASG